MKTTTITPLSRVKPKTRCPDCASGKIRRSSSLDRVKGSIDTGTLFSIHEGCIMCGWSRTLENVKMGA